MREKIQRLKLWWKRVKNIVAVGRRMHSFMDTDTFKQAQLAVQMISENGKLRTLGEKEGQISFCPRCGQRPDQDVRHDEAFELAFGKLPPTARSKDLHFAVELARWIK